MRKLQVFIHPLEFPVQVSIDNKVQYPQMFWVLAVA
jgi:hypothetical protein